MKNNKLIELLKSIERILIIENDKEKVVYEKSKKIIIKLLIIWGDLAYVRLEYWNFKRT